MFLGSRDSKFVEVKIVGYQFPDKLPDPRDKAQYDANWLIIETRFRESNQDWVFTAPCMLTTEAEQIYKWLLTIELGTAKPVIGGLEPEITFKLLKCDSHKVKMRFKYMHWEKSEKRWRHHYVVLELSYADLKWLATEWYAEIQRFPVRYRASTVNNN